MKKECGFPNDRNPSATLVTQGPQIDVVISFKTTETEQNQIPPRLINMPALIDTGAKSNLIDSGVAKVLDLPIVNKQKITGSNGTHIVDVYLAEIEIPSLNQKLYGQFAGVHLTAGELNFGALLGREFLKNLTMSYDGLTGSVIITNNK